MLAVDHQRRVVEQTLVAKIEGAGRPHVVTRRPYEHDVPAPLGHRNASEVIGQSNHHRHARRIVECRIVVPVHVGHHIDGLVGRARQHPKDTWARQPLTCLRLDPRRDRHGFAGSHEVSQRPTVFKSQEEPRSRDRLIDVTRGPIVVADHLECVGALPDREVPSVAPDAEDERGPQLLGPDGRTLPGGGVPHLAGRQDGLDDHRLASNVAPGKISRGPETDPDRLHAVELKRLRPHRGIGRHECQRVVTGRRGQVPIDREPLGSKIEVDSMDVVHAEPSELRLGPIGGHYLVLGARDPSPVTVPVVSATARKSHHLFQPALQPAALDIGVDSVFIGERAPEMVIRLFPHEPVGVD